jgi:hypothetical protein
MAENYDPVIKQEDLQDGVYYNGRSRNASVARWDDKTRKFYYIRTKFGRSFVESIHCPENDKVYDVFIAESICPTPPFEIDPNEASQ